MKRWIALFMSIMLILSLAACGTDPAGGADNGQNGTDSSREENSENAAENSRIQPEEDTEPSDVSEPSDVPEAGSDNDGKTLIVYFSWSPSGNTEKMAATIQEQTGGTLYEIIPAEAYPTDYTETTEVAQEEKDNNARPEIEDLPESISEYGRILVGYPIWWHTAPMIIGTFLEHYDLAGVDVYPFSQSASMDEEQFEESMEFVRRCAGDANVHDGLFVDADDTDGIIAYLNENGLMAGEPQEAENPGSNVLIAYFSVPEDVDTSGVDAVAGASIVVRENEVMGNTEYVAKVVQQTIGGDLFRIETVQQYPLDHDPLVDQAAEEQDADARPELATHIENLQKYDSIILGFPKLVGRHAPALVYLFGGV